MQLNLSVLLVILKTINLQLYYFRDPIQQRLIVLIECIHYAAYVPYLAVSLRFINVGGQGWRVGNGMG
jgi:hypothetical protein